MNRCAICTHPIQDPAVIHVDGEEVVHPTCLAGRLRHDAVVALIAAAVLVVVPPIVVWAG